MVLILNNMDIFILFGKARTLRFQKCNFYEIQKAVKLNELIIKSRTTASVSGIFFDLTKSRLWRARGKELKVSA